MLEQIKKFREYLDYIEEHYNNVQKAWQLIQDKCDNKFRFIWDDFAFFSIDANVKAHDLSKLSANEFTQYRQFFFPTDSEIKDKALFEQAWEHHKANNPHHWENWTVNYAEHPYVDIWLVENIIDWVAMGFKFGDTAKAFYEKNKDKIQLPEWAIKEMYLIFDCIYPETNEGNN